MSFANSDSFTSSVSVWMDFFPCLIAVMRTSNTILNRSGKSGHSYLVSDFGEKTFSFSPWSMLVLVGL